MPAYWADVEEVSAVVALVGVPYLVAGNRKRLPHLAFSFASSQREGFEQGGLDFGRVTFSGTIRNRSLEDNSIEKVFLVVWKSKRRIATLRFGFGPRIFDENGQQIGPPLRLLARSSVTVKVVAEFPLTGTGDLDLFTALKPLAGSAGLYLSKYEYELAFEDVAGNLFDKDGYPRSRKGINLRWTLGNSTRKFKQGHPMALVRHLALIGWEETRFAWKRLVRLVGL